jgi:Skp family chaperone for outer membrane proteins
MRLAKLTLVVLAVSGLASPVAAQQASPASPQKGKIAVINTAELQVQILEFKTKVEAINKQFEPQTKELQTEADRINALETTLKTQSQSLTAARIAEMTEQLGTMKRQYTRKAEDVQAAGERAMTQALGPLKEKMRKFLEYYTTKKSIAVLIDLANSAEANTILWIDPRIDITQDFIAEYNRSNPVPGGGATPSNQ